MRSSRSGGRARLGTAALAALPKRSAEVPLTLEPDFFRTGEPQCQPTGRSLAFGFGPLRPYWIAVRERSSSKLAALRGRFNRVRRASASISPSARNGRPRRTGPVGGVDAHLFSSASALSVSSNAPPTAEFALRPLPPRGQRDEAFVVVDERLCEVGHRVGLGFEALLTSRVLVMTAAASRTFRPSCFCHSASNCLRSTAAGSNVSKPASAAE